MGWVGEEALEEDSEEEKECFDLDKLASGAQFRAMQR